MGSGNATPARDRRWMGSARFTRGGAGRDLARVGGAFRTRGFARTADSACRRAHLGRLASCRRSGCSPDLGGA